MSSIAVAGLPRIPADWQPTIGPVLGLVVILWARYAPNLLPKDLQKSAADDLA